MTLRAALLAVLFAVPTLAAGPVDGLRARAGALRGQVGALRSQQLATRNELSVLSARIETLKERASGRLLPGGELDAALKRSQELSTSLTGLAQELSTQQGELTAASLALADELSQELTRLRAAFDQQRDRVKRRALIEQMKQARAERESVRASLPATALPSLTPVRPSEDPEELLEQADLLRDNEEKLQARLKAVEGRLAERREERELDTRVRRFMDEESMFDDQDRRLRVSRTTTITTKGLEANGFTANGTPDPAAPPATTEVLDTAGGLTPMGTTGRANNDAAPGGGPFGASSLGGPQAAPAEKSGADQLDSSSVRVTTASDARPQVGKAPAVASGDEDDIEDLEVERARLKGLTEQLRRKARELEKKASQLR